MRESDLFPPIRRLFEDLGYVVHAEVKNCDVTATKGDELIVVELKKSLTTKLLAQAVTRQKTGALVYVAIPKPKKYRPRAYRETLDLLKKLELGLIFVNLPDGNAFAEVVQDPEPFAGLRLDPRKKAGILKEINARSVEMNQGGITRTKIVTAYTERCIHIACALQKFGEMSPKAISQLGIAHKDVYSILQKNHYGWFYRVEKGVYALTLKGRRELSQYPEFVTYYNTLLEKK